VVTLRITKLVRVHIAVGSNRLPCCYGNAPRSSRGSGREPLAPPKEEEAGKTPHAGVAARDAFRTQQHLRVSVLLQHILCHTLIKNPFTSFYTPGI